MVLRSLLFGQDSQTIALDDFPCVYEGSDDGPWVHRLPSDLVDRLAAMSPGELIQVARAWSETDELRDMERRWPGTVGEALAQIVQLTRMAKQSGQGVYLWTSL